MNEHSSQTPVEIDDSFDFRAYHAQFDRAMIVASSENDVIGDSGDLPWHLPRDLKHFMQSTEGCPVIMGRKTYESLDQPLPARLNIILSRSMSTTDLDESIRESVRITKSLECALQIAEECEMQKPIWIAGGGDVYAQSMGLIDLIVRTRVHTTLDGDTCVPTIDQHVWSCSYIYRYESDDRHPFSFDIQWWVRNGERTECE